MRQLRELAGGSAFDPDADPGTEIPEFWSEIFWPELPVLDDGGIELE